jgi:hypothetical protein
MASSRCFGLALILTLFGCASSTEEVDTTEGQAVTDPDPEAPAGCRRQRGAVSAGGSDRRAVGVISCPGKPDLAYLSAQRPDGSIAIVRRSTDYPAPAQDMFRKTVAGMLTGGIDALTQRKLSTGLDDVADARKETDPAEQQDLRQTAHEDICFAVMRRAGLDPKAASNAAMAAACRQLAPGAALPQ